MSQLERKLLYDLNNRTWKLADHCRNMAHLMGVRSFSDESGAKILDFGVGRSGTISGGLALAMISLGDLADVQLLPAGADLGLPIIQVSTDHPLEACIASQYAGWPFAHEDYFSMCSGPARMARGKEDLLTEYDLEISMDRVVGVLEANKFPPADAIRHFADECCVDPKEVTFCIARTASLPGSIQVVARSVETTLHKLHELKFDLRLIKSAMGAAPLPPIAKNDLTSLGWTNDAILYGARTHLWVDCEDEQITSIGPNIPSNSSKDFGKPFIEIFERYDRDFYKIDKMLFSPAEVVINNFATGSSFRFGEVRHDILKSSFGIAK